MNHALEIQTQKSFPFSALTLLIFAHIFQALMNGFKLCFIKVQFYEENKTWKRQENQLDPTYAMPISTYSCHMHLHLKYVLPA